MCSPDGNRTGIRYYNSSFFCLDTTLLHAENDRDDERVLVGLLEEEAGDRVGDVVFYRVEVDWVHAGGGVLDSLLDNDARLLEEVLRFTQVDEAAGDDVRRLAQFPGARVDGRNDDEHAVFGKQFPVTDNDLLDVADREAVHHAQSGRCALFERAYLLAVIRYLDYHAVVRYDDVFLGETDLFGDFRMCAEHVMVAVDGDEEARIHFLVYPLHLIVVCMTA